MLEAEQTVPEVKIFPETGNAKEIIYRTGEAPRIIEPKPVHISGDIKSVANFLKVRKTAADGVQQVKTGSAFVEVDKSSLTIKLVLDAESDFGSTVAGKLLPAPELADFGINTTKIFTRESFIKLLKFNRIYFSNYTQHETLLASLLKNESSVQYNSKDESDDRANKDSTFLRKVTTTVPESFVLDIPIFKGFGTETIKVDICLGVTGGKLEFWFESVALAELQKTKVDVIFNEELKAAEGLVIIYK